MKSKTTIQIKENYSMHRINRIIKYNVYAITVPCFDLALATHCRLKT